MKIFLKSLSYILHPLFVPLMGAFGYFLITPKYSPVGVESNITLPTFILTIIIPIIAFFILKNIGLISTIFAPTVQQRRYPLFIHIVLLLIMVYKVVPDKYYLELHYFFMGLLTSSITALLLLFINKKVSLHLMAMGNLVMFAIGLSIHFEVNIATVISALILATGLLATSRLYLKAHSKVEVFIGFFIGLFAQLFMFKFWL